MWYQLGKWVLRNRLLLLLGVLAATGVMTWQASKVQLSYEFSKAIPLNHPKYQEYQAFKQQFGEDGNLLVLGLQTDSLFELSFFQSFVRLQRELRNVDGVEDVLSVSNAIGLVKAADSEQLKTVPLFPDTLRTQAGLDSARARFENLPFYRHLFYNPDTRVYMIGVRINKELLNSKERNRIVEPVVKLAEAFELLHGVDVHMSGLPLVRTVMSTRIADEMQLFLLGSVLLSAFILLLFFRSFSSTLLSMAVVVMGVIWSLGTMVLFGFKITLLNALIPPLIVVIGIPNCIYFLNKFHTEFKKSSNKHEALVNMVGRMGIVTLFCNIAAAIGFAVFALTDSAILKEFGIVAGINIMVLFVLSFLFIPAVLSYLPAPKKRHIRYLENPQLNRTLIRIENWVLYHPKYIYTATAVLVVVSLLGILRLKSVGYIVDDLPKKDIIYTDLKFFETHFSGVMPLEVVVDTRRKQGVTRQLSNLQKIDELLQYLYQRPEMGKPLAITEGLKFARQAYYDGDSALYGLPTDFDLAFLAPYLQMRPGGGGNGAGNFSKLLGSFMDSSRQQARISINMTDVGSDSLPRILAAVQAKAEEIFNADSLAYARELAAAKTPPGEVDSARLQRKANIRLTGTSVTFLEGSRFIINGLKESIFWAFLLIALTMLYLFRSGRILLCSLIPNVVPLLITAGTMGWVGVPLKPSTVLVFSVALGIAIDVTIRFLVNYKQELPQYHNRVVPTVKQTIRHTGISIIYTSLVLVAGFIIFCFSNFGGTQALGWLTSLTLLVAMITNLVLLPVLLLTTSKYVRK
ncbi:MAG TPA: MMPL family transporter [Lacibacter sp.]|nr:MMPL family transporter [Lacibacter sp.]HMO88076.1 MMPL family transporter [Lacibacter sp.]